jgi:hypothetical protein
MVLNLPDILYRCVVLQGLKEVGNAGNFQEPEYLIRFSCGLWAGLPEFDSRQGQEIFIFSTASKLALGHTQPPIQWVPELKFEAEHYM